jgi:hypothetical protein
VTPAPLPPEEIERLKTLMEKATRTPWRLGADLEAICVGGNTPDAFTSNGWAKTIARIAKTTWCLPEQRFANARLVPAVVNALPALLAEIEAGRAGAERVTKEDYQRLFSLYETQCAHTEQLAVQLQQAQSELAALRQTAQPSDGAIPNRGDASRCDAQMAAWARTQLTTTTAAQPSDGARVLADAWRAVGECDGITVSVCATAAETWNRLCRLLDPLVGAAPSQLANGAQPAGRVSDEQTDAAYQAWFVYWTQECPDQSERQSESRDYCRAAMRKAISAAFATPPTAGAVDEGENGR